MYSEVELSVIFNILYLGAVHELPCKAYILHTARTQEGLNKDLRWSGKTAFNWRKVLT